MTEDEIGSLVVDVAVQVHREMGLVTYLRLADKRLGHLLNFGEALMKHGITRIANRLPEGPH